jgi:hypothetical protein
MPSDSSDVPYRFRFFTAGGVDQLIIDAGALPHLGSLDKKLWVALACPTKGLEIDSRTLEIIDTDKDGRIRPPELLAAVAWAIEVFVDLKDLFKPLKGNELPLSALSDKTDTGKAVRASARRVLTNLGREDADSLLLDDVLDSEKIFKGTKLNGDGIVPVGATDDVGLQAVITDVLKVMGAVKDRGGEPGVDKVKTDAFFEQADKYAAWLDLGANDTVHVAGDQTADAVAAMTAVRGKIDDYFVRARLAAYEEKLAPMLDASSDDATALAGKELGLEDAEVAKWPLSHVIGGGSLSLTRAINPAWSSRIEAFIRLTLTPLDGAGRTSLTEAEWTAIKARLSAFVGWAALKPDLPIAALDAARITELAKGDARTQLADLIAKDAALDAESSQIDAVEKAIRLRRDLVPLLRNFISFADFYGRRDGTFQTGTLYIDGRSCDLVLAVNDVAKHALLASLAKAYLLYCECTRKGEEKRVIVAAMTAGDVDNLMVGRNGLFYDKKGRDWDATVTKIVENPISVRQAFFSPYKRFVRGIEEQVAKRAAAADAKANKGLDAHATKVATADATPVAPAGAPAAEPEKKGIDIGTVAAIGVAVGGIATFFSSIMATFFGLGMWMPIGLAGLLLASSGPSMLIASLKLRQRNIGPILDASGWAVNAFARINVPFGGALTDRAELPKGSTRLLDDPFAEKKAPVVRVVLAILVILLIGAWGFGKLDGILPTALQRDTVLHHAPAASGRPAESAAPLAPPAPATSAHH